MQWWKKWQNRPTWGGKECKKMCSVFGLRPSVSFCSASANHFHFGASLLSPIVLLTSSLVCGDWLIITIFPWLFSMLTVLLSSYRTVLISALTALASRPHQWYFKALWVKLGGIIAPVTRVLHRGDDCLNVNVSSCSRASVTAYSEQNKRCGFSFVWLMNAVILLCECRQTERWAESLHTHICQSHSYSVHSVTVQYCAYIRFSCIDHHIIL